MAYPSPMKHEIIDIQDDSDDNSGPIGIQKVPSISDLSDPEASLGKY